MGVLTDKLKSDCSSLGLRYVDNRGDKKAPLWIVGEAPGAEEDQNGLPFVGSSGKELDRMIHDAGLSPWDICFTNPYKIRPPDNDMSKLASRGIPLERYEEAFLEELREYKPTFICAAGATPLRVLVPNVGAKRGGEVKISLWRGSLLQSDKLDWPHYVLPMYHPAFILREWAERPIGVFCLERLKEELDYYRSHTAIQPLPARRLGVGLSADDVIAYLHDCLQLPPEQYVSNDIEMIRGVIPYTISIAKSPYEAISFSLWNYDDEKLIRIWRLLDEVLRLRKTIGQNYIGFDILWLQTLGLRPNPWVVSDTMVRHHALWPEFEHKLQFLTFQYTREPYYKDEGRLWSPKDGLDKLMLYNCKDSAVTYEVHDAQEREFAERPVARDFYERVLSPRGKVLHQVEKRGILTSPERLRKLSYYIDEETRKSCAELTKECGRVVCASKEHATSFVKSYNAKALPHEPTLDIADVLNIASPAQVMEQMRRLKLRIPVDRKTHKPTTAEPKLQEVLAVTGSPFLRELLKIREYNKIKGTYVNAKLANNVLYCSYIITATVTYRLGSRATVFGLGTNHQNIPKHSPLGKRFRECMIARPGKIFIECDQNQAEDWIVQAIITDVSGHRKGLDELINGIDRHRELASFIFTLPREKCGRGSIERYLGKKTHHAGNYDMHAQTMSESLAKEGYIMTVPYCEFLLYRFHQFEPEIKQVYHAYIQQVLNTEHRLQGPLGGERYFMSLRPFADNSKIFREGYAHIPQTTVATNTGLAELYIADHGDINLMIADGHDAIFLEVDDNEASVFHGSQLLKEAFNRQIVFPHGTTIQIPVDVAFGYDLKNMTECKSLCQEDILSTYNEVREKQMSSVAIGN